MIISTYSLYSKHEIKWPIQDHQKQAVVTSKAKENKIKYNIAKLPSKAG